jgi:hypothetical protein
MNEDERKALMVGGFIILACTVFVSLCAGWIPFHLQVCTEGNPPSCVEGTFPFYLLLMTKPYSEVLTAFGTLVLAAFTYTLWRATYTQADLTRRSIELAKEEFNVSHRPRLRVRHLNFLFSEGQTSVSHEAAAEVEVTVVNVGDREMRGFEFFYAIGWFTSPNDAMSAYYEFQQVMKSPNTVLVPGAFEHLSFVVQPMKSDQAASITPPSKAKVMMLARVDYWDSEGTKRSTGYFRESPGSREDGLVAEFAIVDHNDYEYED